MGGALHLGCRQSLKEDFTIALASEFDLLFIRSVPFLSLKLINNPLCDFHLPLPSRALHSAECCCLP